jgi:hypothetical protein
MQTGVDIVRFLGRAGPQPAGVLRDALGLSHSAFQRAISTTSGLLVTGKGRATHYAVRRDIAGVITPIPIFERDASGDTRLALRLHPVAPFGHYVEACCEDVTSGFHEADPRDLSGGPDLPWFLLDLAPVGFLGRAWGRAHAEQGFPGDLARWTGDDILRYAAYYGTDLPGALVVGGFALERLDALRPPVTEPAQFPDAAERAAEASTPSSSAGGDQPKFAISRPDGAAIVKFSPPTDTPGGQRWADLLAAEHIVHGVLRDAGFDAPASRIVDARGRRFLEVERFDRHGPTGRSGVVSLFALDRAGVGSALHRWSPVTAALVRSGRIAAAVQDRVRWLEAFGDQIGNTDMHLGNLSLRMRGTQLLGLAPIYDMLPMYYATGHGGELRTRLFQPIEAPGVPEAGGAARTAWARIAAHPAVSESFRSIARHHAGAA